MRSSGLNRLIMLTAPGGEIIGRDEFNAPILSPCLPVEVLAEYMTGGGAEKLAANEVQAAATVKFRVRWSPAMAEISPTWRLTFDGRDYDIAAATETGHRDAIEITAMARAE